MKLFLASFLLIIHMVSVAQVSDDLLGTWKLKKVVNTNGKKYARIKTYTLTLNADQTYLMYFGGTSGIHGQWILDGNKIRFDAKTIVDPCMEWTTDENFRGFEITENGMLIIDVFMCGTGEGKSHFKKMKRTRSV